MKDGKPIELSCDEKSAINWLCKIYPTVSIRAAQLFGIEDIQAIDFIQGIGETVFIPAGLCPRTSNFLT